MFGKPKWEDFDFYISADDSEVVITAISKTNEFNAKEFKIGMKHCLKKFLTRKGKKLIMDAIKEQIKEEPQTSVHEWSVQFPLEGSSYESMFIAVYPTKESYKRWIKEYEEHTKRDIDVA